jgi:hypothetical protein
MCIGYTKNFWRGGIAELASCRLVIHYPVDGTLHRRISKRKLAKACFQAEPAILDAKTDDRRSIVFGRDAGRTKFGTSSLDRESIVKLIYRVVAYHIQHHSIIPAMSDTATITATSTASNTPFEITFDKDKYHKMGEAYLQSIITITHDLEKQIHKPFTLSLMHRGNKVGPTYKKDGDNKVYELTAEEVEECLIEITNTEEVEVEVKCLLESYDDTDFIAIFPREKRDVDGDGNKYYRALRIEPCGCEYPFKIQKTKFNEFIKHQTKNGYYIAQCKCCDNIATSYTYRRRKHNHQQEVVAEDVAEETTKEGS